MFWTLPILNSRYVRSFQFPSSGSIFGIWMTPLITLIIYVFTVEYFKQYMKLAGKPLQLGRIVAVYNIVMASLSLLLFLAFASEIGHIILQTRFTLFDLLCNHMGVFNRGRLVFYYFINYIFKYIELADTFFLLFRGKKVTFLHEYHHAATLALAFTQLLSSTCLQWVVIMINLLLHVFLYSYYACCELSIPFKYKQWLTRGQIIQFVVDVLVCLYIIGLRAVWTFFPESEHGAKCMGTWSGSGFGIVILVSYLGLFVQFYKESYLNPNSKHRAYEAKRFL